MARKTSKVNTISPLMGGDIERKIMNCNDCNIRALTNEFSNNDFKEMACWSQNHAFGSIDDEIFDDDIIASEARVQFVEEFITDCLMMAVQGQMRSSVYKQKDLVTHFYNLWMAVNGGC